MKRAHVEILALVILLVVVSLYVGISLYVGNDLYQKFAPSQECSEDITLCAQMSGLYTPDGYPTHLQDCGFFEDLNNDEPLPISNVLDALVRNGWNLTIDDKRIKRPPHRGDTDR